MSSLSSLEDSGFNAIRSSVPLPEVPVIPIDHEESDKENAPHVPHVVSYSPALIPAPEGPKLAEVGEQQTVASDAPQVPQVLAVPPMQLSTVDVNQPSAAVPPLVLSTVPVNTLPQNVLPLLPSPREAAAAPRTTEQQSYPSRPSFEPSALRVKREKTCFEKGKSVFSSDSDGEEIVIDDSPAERDEKRRKRSKKVVYLAEDPQKKTLRRRRGHAGEKGEESKKDSLPFSDPVAYSAQEGQAQRRSTLLKKHSVASNLSRGVNSLVKADIYSSQGSFLEESFERQLRSRERDAKYISLLLRIHGMSTLHADTCVVHPFFRVWVVNAITGENLCYMDKPQPCAITQPFDLRSNQTRAPFWNAEVCINIDRQKLVKDPQRTVLLFELLDVGCETIHGFYYPSTGIYPIAWAYCFLHNSVGQMQEQGTGLNLQLFRFPYRTPWWLSCIQSLLPRVFSADSVEAPSVYSSSGATKASENRVPLLYSVFADPRNRKIPYESGVCVSLQVPKEADPALRPTPTSRYEEYLLNTLCAQLGSCSTPKCVTDTEDFNALVSRARSRKPMVENVRRVSQGLVNYNALGQPYFCRPEERSLPPTETLQTVPVYGKVTCMTFSKNGSFLALGVSRNLQHVIEIRNPLAADLTVYAELSGHVGHIYSIVLQNSDEHMLSCSSDRTVRVWKVASIFSVDLDESETSRNACLCTLPHGYPIYTAIFHQGHIVTGGYNECLTVWNYSAPTRPLSVSSSEVGGSRDSSLQLTQNFNPAMKMATTVLGHNDDTGSGRENSVSDVLTGQLVDRVSNEENVIFTSLGSTEKGHRLWSVSSSGKVCGWRAVYEGKQSGKSVWQMTVNKKQTHECIGAGKVHVGEEFTVVSSVSAPLVHIFDTKSCERLRLVRAVPVDSPVCLLSDGKAFVAGTRDGKLMCWDCFDGALCTPSGGYAKVRTRFPIHEICWGYNQQLAAIKSQAPCPSGVLSSTLPHVNWEMSALNAENPLQAEVTIISIVGTKRDEGSVILNDDKTAAEDFCLRFGGELDAKKKATLKARREAAIRERQDAKEHASERLYPREKNNLRIEASEFTEDSFREPEISGAGIGRINAIIHFWKGLVDQHRRNGADSTLNSHLESQSRDRNENDIRRSLDYDENLV
ncbi:WD domain, G-beta repeat, putative [Angomonas deanei]|uniref:WD domain, G-beta repeat, putative n=1 Tax=Angomonas deanei TaxID=59799 RepID=A0A7G2C9V9_9TRYP|nr:WD domain, G-beta repeat, putative [Angomonas deanei]